MKLAKSKGNFSGTTEVEEIFNENIARAERRLEAAHNGVITRVEFLCSNKEPGYVAPGTLVVRRLNNGQIRAHYWGKPNVQTLALNRDKVQECLQLAGVSIKPWHKTTEIKPLDVANSKKAANALNALTQLMRATKQDVEQFQPPRNDVRYEQLNSEQFIQIVNDTFEKSGEIGIPVHFMLEVASKIGKDLKGNLINHLLINADKTAQYMVNNFMGNISSLAHILETAKQIGDSCKDALDKHLRNNSQAIVAHMVKQLIEGTPPPPSSVYDTLKMAKEIGEPCSRDLVNYLLGAGDQKDLWKIAELIALDLIKNRSSIRNALDAAKEIDNNKGTDIYHRLIFILVKNEKLNSALQTWPQDDLTSKEKVQLGLEKEQSVHYMTTMYDSTMEQQHPSSSMDMDIEKPKDQDKKQGFFG